MSGLVTLDIGYNESSLKRHFIGYVERCAAVNGVEQIVLCREMAAALAKSLPMNLRHVDLRAVLTDISSKTGFRFHVPDQAYTKVKAPYFYSLAAGYQAMDSMGTVFGMPDFIWQQQGDGEVFVGSWRTAALAFGLRCSCRSAFLTVTRAIKAPWSRPCPGYD